MNGLLWWTQFLYKWNKYADGGAVGWIEDTSETSSFLDFDLPSSFFLLPFSFLEGETDFYFSLLFDLDLADFSDLSSFFLPLLF